MIPDMERERPLRRRVLVGAVENPESSEGFQNYSEVNDSNESSER